MNNEFQPNVANDIRRIHSIITRALNVSIENIPSLRQKGTGVRDGFLNYLQCLATVINGHHLAEDEIGFPYFRDKIPEMPYDDMILQHKEMVVELEKVTAAVNAARGMNDISSSIASMPEALNSLFLLSGKNNGHQ